MNLAFFREQKNTNNTQPALQTKVQIIINNHLVLINGKLHDILRHPLKTRLRPGPQAHDKTNPTKNGSQRKSGTHKEKKLHP